MNESVQFLSFGFLCSIVAKKANEGCEFRGSLNERDFSGKTNKFTFFEKKSWFYFQKTQVGIS
jgi:hypothetical protein